MDLSEALSHEWLVTNGLGGYAMGNAAGVPTRSYHAPLVAAVEGGRRVLVQHLVEVARADGEQVALSGYEAAHGPSLLPSLDHLLSFRLRGGVPSWSFRVGAGRLDKRLLMVGGQNNTLVHYRWTGTTPLTLEVRPLLHLRDHNQPVDLPQHEVTTDRIGNWLLVFEKELSAVGLMMDGSELIDDEPPRTIALLRGVELARGYAGVGPALIPGKLVRVLEPGEEAVLVLCADQTIPAPIEVFHAQENVNTVNLPLTAREPVVATLAGAASRFVTRCGARATITAGFPWFADWGRDAFISLEGLLIVTGRAGVAELVLEDFARWVRDGLVPNHYPEDGSAPLYNSADASLWFIHAVGRLEEHLKDRSFIKQLLPTLREIIEAYRGGTRFGIGVDPEDGLLRQGEAGLQLTWMDAKIGDHVVTPRRGKAVELNALWYGALRRAAQWFHDYRLDNEADRVAHSFNRRFWSEAHGHLYDVVDGEQGDDASLRPNQLFAFSLPHPVLARERWKPVLEAVRGALWTPRGLRTLAPSDPRYRGRHAGDVATRDAAYHNGTVWPWLLGAFVDAELAVDPSCKPRVRRELEGILQTLDEGVDGMLAEVFSGDAPHAPEGAPAQAWSVAEVLRALSRLA